MRRSVGGLVALLAMVGPQIVRGQSRELHWKTLDVTAHLDSSGRLHVRERHVMVFTGEWNGGERRFNIRLGQRLTLERMLRADSSTGAEREMPQGALDVVNNYDWTDNSTLRWRSRAPTDPPFQETSLTYIIEYTLSNILVPRGEGFVLDNDFAFPDRDGDIEQFNLSLSVDRNWGTPAGFSGSYGPMRLPPGEGFVVNVPLSYRGLGSPAGVLLGTSAVLRYALGALLLLTLVVLVARFVTGERATGRFAALTPPSQVNEAWVTEHVLHMLPEVVGAAWDDTTGAPEVAAVLARLVGEKKLGSRVETRKFLFFTSNTLHLKLLVPRSALSGYELDLVESLFMPGEAETDTDRVRKRYSKSGFDPASKIKGELERLVQRLSPRASERAKPSRWPTVVGVAASGLLVASSGQRSVSDVVVAGVAAGIMTVLFISAAVQSTIWRTRVHAWASGALSFAVPMTVATIGVLVLLYTGNFRLGFGALAGLTVYCLALWNSVFNLARARQAPEMIALRKKLASAREYFQRELAKQQPALRDEWFPYLMAFGLGPQMDKWFRAFGGTTSMAHVSTSRSSDGYSSGSTGGGSWSGFGGGGGFAGGGSSGAWAAAVGTMAAGVSAPSKSSSGGGGGGGGSSGGGGGGGW